VLEPRNAAVPSSFRFYTGAQFALFRSVTFPPTLGPTKSQPPFQGNRSEGSVLFIELLHFFHLDPQERKPTYFP